MLRMVSGISHLSAGRVESQVGATPRHRAHEGLPFGFAHTGTLTGVGELTWSVEFEDWSKLSEVSGDLAVEPGRASQLRGSHAAG